MMRKMTMRKRRTMRNRVMMKMRMINIYFNQTTPWSGVVIG